MWWRARFLCLLMAGAAACPWIARAQEPDWNQLTSKLEVAADSECGKAFQEGYDQARKLELHQRIPDAKFYNDELETKVLSPPDSACFERGFAAFFDALFKALEKETEFKEEAAVTCVNLKEKAELDADLVCTSLEQSNCGCSFDPYPDRETIKDYNACYFEAYARAFAVCPHIDLNAFATANQALDPSAQKLIAIGSDQKGKTEAGAGK